MTPKPLALIIEDDLDLSEIFAQALEAAGFDTEIIRDGRTGMQRLEGTVPHTIILDLHLPYVDGTKILEKVRLDERMSNVRVVVTTADTVSAELLRDTADFVLVKPISFAQLRDLAIRLNPERKLGFSY
jgi:DNA-binding response OmpR family regulator